MACSLRRRWKPSRRSSSGCMAADGGGRVAVLLMAYGGPGSLDEVEPYLQDVRGGRPTAPELVQEIRQRYARIGGRSPIRELTEAQAAGVRRALAQDKRVAVYVGMRDRKSTRLNSSHGYISYAPFCLKKKKLRNNPPTRSR